MNKVIEEDRRVNSFDVMHRRNVPAHHCPPPAGRNRFADGDDDDQTTTDLERIGDEAEKSPA